jgi:hypothetical protein
MNQNTDSIAFHKRAGLKDLPFEKAIHVDRLLTAIGSHADSGTSHTIATLADRLSEGALAKVLESVNARRGGRVVNRAGYVVRALQSELREVA